jgi:hypothetical protein
MIATERLRILVVSIRFKSLVWVEQPVSFSEENSPYKQRIYRYQSARFVEDYLW